MLNGKMFRGTLQRAHALFRIARNPLHRRVIESPAVIRCLRTSSVCSAKLFVDKENKFAHDILEQSLKTYQILRLDEEPSVDATELSPFVLQPPKEFGAGWTTNDVFKAFSSLTRHCIATSTHISDERFRHFTLQFCEIIPKLSDEQLVETLRQLARLPTEESTKSPNFMELWNKLDVECCRRIEGWRTDQLLLVCDAWYALNLSRVCEFVWEALRKLGRKVRRMRPEQLVQSMFLCNLLRRPLFEMFNFEENLAQCADSMTLQELGIMAMGFFKTQTPIRNPELLETLYKRLMAELDTVEDITLVQILKVLRYSSKLPQVNLMTELQGKLRRQVERISLLSCLHVALLGCDMQCCDEELIELILQRFNGSLEQARLKDLERICLAIGIFNYDSPSGIVDEVCVKSIQVLRTKIDEILKYPRCFPTCLHFLSLRGYHDVEMISSVLDPKFIRHAYGTNMTLGRELFHLDAFAKINLKDAPYEGNQLSEKNRRTMGKLLTHYIPERNPKYKLSTTDRILLEIKETLDRIFRPNAFKHILPHFQRPDVVVCYDRQQRKVVPVSTDCPEDYSGVILTRQHLLGSLESANIDTVAVIIAGWNNVVRGKNRYTALFDMKLKQLELLGHKHIVINWHEWREQETQHDRQNFLKRKFARVTNL